MIELYNILVYDRYDGKYAATIRGIYYMAYYLSFISLFSDKDNRQTYGEMRNKIIKAIILSLLLIGGCTAIMFNHKTTIDTDTELDDADRLDVGVNKKDTIK